MQGELHGADARFCGVSTDTRTLSRGELFFALHGPNFDGREFVMTAATKQAAAAVVEKPVDAGIANITVDDARLALGRLAASWRQQMSARVLAVTGSNGKTTVKEMIASCLSLSGSTLATEGNLNNDIGVPLMLLRLGRENEYGVFELGANHTHEIAYLTGLVRPDLVLITNAAAAHLEGFGNVEGVAHAKGEILQAEPAPQCAILNRDDEFYELWLSMAGNAPIVSFGTDPHADVRATAVSSTDKGSEFTLLLPETTLEIVLPLAGAHNVLNACAAAATAVAFGVPAELIRQGLMQARPANGRLRPLDGIAGMRLFDDSYNANPASVIAAAEFLASQAGESCMVLGDMAELGADAGLLHESVGQAIRDAGIARLFAVGEQSKQAVTAFGEKAEWFTSVDALIEGLVPVLRKRPVSNVLVKGSRSMRMERVVAVLAQENSEEVR
jgi:UDP-N-acetylmuramoyl-tripeptide--D-alanyl-D-alanine ligase